MIKTVANIGSFGGQGFNCPANHHVSGLCRHPGSKPNLKLAKHKRRAKNRAARKSRIANR